MLRISLKSALPLYRRKQALVTGTALGALCGVLSVGCTEAEHRHGEQQPNPYLTPDTRHPIALSASARKEHRAVMLQHLETIQVIMNALVEEDYDLAKGLTESHLGFFMHRQAMASQQSDNFPPAYHDLAVAHHEAAEELARIIPTKDLKQILPKFNNVLKTCVACHLEYKLQSS
jgi:Cytochrome C'